MLASQRCAAFRGASARFGPALPPRPAGRTLVIRRFRDDDKAKESMVKEPTEPRISQQQIEEVLNTEGQISPRRAELRADMGRAATDLHTMQAFDGPIPETVNGRLCMISLFIGLAEEWLTGNGLLEQLAAHPLRVLLVTVAITFASYVPVFRGYTRKEPFVNKLGGVSWSPQAENWNGRLAMLGFLGMIATEWVTGVNTLQAWGLQEVYFGIRHTSGF